MKASHVDVYVEAFVVQAVSVAVRPGRHGRFGSEYGVVGWDVEEAVSERVSTSVFLTTVVDDPHPALQDFLLEVRSVSPTTVKESVDIAVHAAIERAVDRTVSGSVDDASNRAVWRTVASPVDWTVYEAVWTATVKDPSHPALQDFVHSVRRI